MQQNSDIEIWGGIEATLNRVGDQYHDQLEYTGHYYRRDDIDTIATLGIKALRYPVLWEHHQPQKDTNIDWRFAEKNLLRLRELGIKPIVGLVHHGSGPQFVSFFNGSFEKGLAAYAGTVAEKFPWIEYYTPVNEPLTTARFCGLYGHWYPHLRDEHSVCTILISECKATVQAMQAIRRVTPGAKLVQTEDLRKTYSTPLLQYQADFMEQRRWLSFDLLCGKINEQHPLWDYLTNKAGISAADLDYFLENPCPPDICGLNYYITSERYLDEEIEKYPTIYYSGNAKHRYADVERVRVDIKELWGAKTLLKDAYHHLHLPIAITECHLHCTRDEQMRWFYQMYTTAQELRQEGIDIRAVTAWALFGTYGWDKLMIEPGGTYETGAFKVTSGYAEPTAFATLLKALSAGKTFHHPVLKHKGWWQRDIRFFYGIAEAVSLEQAGPELTGRPLLITGESGVLSEGFNHICFERNLPVVFVSQQDEDLTDKNVIEGLLRQHNPWAVIHIDGYEKADDVTSADVGKAASSLAISCKEATIRFTQFLPQPADKGTGLLLYADKNENGALCFYNASETEQEAIILKANPDALLIRTGSLFSPWDKTNRITSAIEKLQQDTSVEIHNSYCSFAYVPDVVHIGLDWLLDGESGIYSMINSYQVSEVYLAMRVAESLEKSKDLIEVAYIDGKPYGRNLQLLPMSRRIKLSQLENAIQRYAETVKEIKHSAEAVPA